jgi:uncharacterized membrane protein
MKRLSFLGLLVLAGCAATGPNPVDPVGQFHYGAIGHDPFWLVAIGDERIVLTLGPEGGRADGELQSYQYPRALPREENGIRRWEARSGGQTLVITARRAACSNEGRSYPDTVELRLDRRVLKGCGGREMGGRG